MEKSRELTGLDMHYLSETCFKVTVPRPGEEIISRIVLMEMQLKAEMEFIDTAPPEIVKTYIELKHGICLRRNKKKYTLPGLTEKNFTCTSLN